MNTIGEDILCGADKIAEFVFGDARLRRRVYHLTNQKVLPVFRIGTQLCARRSTLMKWIEGQETGTTAPEHSTEKPPPCN